MFDLVSLWDAENLFRPFDSVGNNDGLFIDTGLSIPDLIGRTSPDNFGNGENSFVFNGATDYIKISKTSCPSGTVPNIFGDCAVNQPCPPGTITGGFNECLNIFGSCPNPYFAKVLICVANGFPNTSLDITNEITIAAWLKPDEGGSTILDKSKSNTDVNYRFFLGGAGATSDTKIGFWNGAQGVQTPTNIPIGTWTHVAMTLASSGNLNFYINGVKDGITHTGFSLGSANDGDLSIGKDPAGRFYDGLIDDVYLYERALLAQEISKLASQGTTERSLSGRADSIAVHAPTNEIYVNEGPPGSSFIKAYSGSGNLSPIPAVAFIPGNLVIDFSIDSDRNIYTTSTDNTVRKWTHQGGTVHDWVLTHIWNGVGINGSLLAIFSGLGGVVAAGNSKAKESNKQVPPGFPEICLIVLGKFPRLFRSCI